MVDRMTRHISATTMNAPARETLSTFTSTLTSSSENLMPIIQYRMNLPEVSDCPGLSRRTSSSFSPAALVEVGPDICFGALICGFRLPFFLSVRVLAVSFMLACRNVWWFGEYLGRTSRSNAETTINCQGTVGERPA